MASPAPNPTTKDSELSPPGTLPPPPAEAIPDSNIDSDSDTDAILAQLESELDLSPVASSPTHPSQALPPAAPIPTGGRTTLPTHNPATPLHTPTTEEALIKATADAPSAVVLFYSTLFASSMRMRDLISSLAREYTLRKASSRDDEEGDGETETLFLAAEAEKCEWLCKRLGVRVLPVVVGYVDGKEVGRVVGFEGLVGGEGADWRALGWVLGRWGVGWSGTMGKGGGGGSLLGKGWMEWVSDRGMGSGGGELESGSESDEDEKDQRRRLGYIGGSRKGYGMKTGGRTRRLGTGEEEDDDDDWN